MMILNTENPIALIIWTVIGCLMAIFFIRSQEKTIALITSTGENKPLTKMFLISVIRMAISIGILLVAFLQSIWLGLACLISFLVTRWITLLISIKKRQKLRLNWNQSLRKSFSIFLGCR